MRRAGEIRIPPPALLALLYGGLVAAGALLLKLPGATTGPLSWLDALFTAASAVTVTGLIVVDTGTHFSIFGQIVILLLIQLGGLGIMTFTVMVLSIMGQPIGLRHRLILREDLNRTSFDDLLRLVRAIFSVVLVFEAVGALVLAVRWVPEMGWAAGLGNAVFHSVSAFNNAGFSLFSNSLSAWVGDPVINLTVPALIIIGGLGFSVLTEINYRRRWRGLSLHTKLTLSGTIVLILGAWLGMLILEWGNPETLGNLAPGAKIAAGWFQSVTTRTAGFNTLDIAALHDSTAFMVITLMLIGGGSTSTAGGIKVTSFIVLLLSTIAFLKRRNAVSAFGRRIEIENVLKVLALTVITMLVVLMGIFLLTLSHEHAFLDVVFEAASAFGTVGLSRGMTGELDAFGQILVMVLMFIGRVGPLSLGFFLTTRARPRLSYPVDHVYLG